MDDVHDSLRARIENDDVGADSGSTVNVGKARQAHFKIVRKRFQTLLQSGRQRAVAVEMLLKSGRKVAATFCQAGREV